MSVIETKGGKPMAAASAPATVGDGTRPCNTEQSAAVGPATSATVGSAAASSTATRREWRRRKNLKRKQSRQRRAAARALPPVVGLGKSEFNALTAGTPEEYDAYCEKLISGAKKAGRRYEFPLEPRRI